jgi:ketosteroid isomerase-like protein
VSSSIADRCPSATAPPDATGALSANAISGATSQTRRRACVEYSVRASMAGGGEYTNDNIAVFRIDGELIREYRDYFDPRRFQVVVDAMSG